MRSNLLLATLAALCLACDNPATTPTPPEIPGAYQAIRLTTIINSVETDLLAAGVTLDLILGADGSSSGALVVPGLAPVDLTGTWAETNGAVRFQQAAETLVGVITFQAYPGQLRADTTIGATRFLVTLQK